MNINTKIADLFLSSINTAAAKSKFPATADELVVLNAGTTSTLKTFMLVKREVTASILPKKKDLSLPPNMPVVDRSKLTISVISLSATIRSVAWVIDPVKRFSHTKYA